MLTIWAGLVDSDDGLLVGGVDGLEGLSFLTLYPLAIDVQAEGLLVGDAGGFDLSGKRHVGRLIKRLFGMGITNIKVRMKRRKRKLRPRREDLFSYSNAGAGRGLLV